MMRYPLTQSEMKRIYNTYIPPTNEIIVKNENGEYVKVKVEDLLSGRVKTYEQ